MLHHGEIAKVTNATISPHIHRLLAHILNLLDLERKRDWNYFTIFLEYYTSTHLVWLEILLPMEGRRSGIAICGTDAANILLCMRIQKLLHSRIKGKAIELQYVLGDIIGIQREILIAQCSINVEYKINIGLYLILFHNSPETSRIQLEQLLGCLVIIHKILTDQGRVLAILIATAPNTMATRLHRATWIAHQEHNPHIGKTATRRI